jgi:aryl carrier-like protein
LLSLLRSLPESLDEPITTLLDPSETPHEPGAATGAAVQAAADPELISVLTGIWAELLGTPEIAVDDNFFALGGDSISLVKVRGRLKRAGFPVPLHTLYENPRMSDLARVLNLTQGAPATPVTTALPDGPWFPVSGTQGQMLDFATEVDGEPMYHVAVSYELELSWWDPAAARSAIGAVAQRHPALRLAFRRDTLGRWEQAVHDETPVRLTVHDWSEESRDSADAMFQSWWKVERHNAIDPSEPSPVRWHLLCLPGGRIRFGCVVHHAVIDGLSLFRLGEEILLAATGNELSPGPQPSAFLDYVLAVQASRQLPTALPFWADTLAGVAPQRLTSLSHGAAGPSHAWESAIPMDVVAALPPVARELGVSERTLFLAAHVAVTARLGEGLQKSGRTVPTGVVLHGRDEETVDGVVGNFLNIAPLVLDSPGSSWRTLIEAVHRAEAAVFAHRRAQFPDVQAALQLPDMFDAVFNYVRFAPHAVGDGLPSVRTDANDPFHYPLVVNVRMTGRSHEGVLVIQARKNCWSREQITQIADNVYAAIRSLAADPTSSPWGIV